MSTAAPSSAELSVNVSSLIVTASAGSVMKIALSPSPSMPLKVRPVSVNETPPLSALTIGVLVLPDFGSSVVPGVLPSSVNGAGFVTVRLTSHGPAGSCRTSPAVAASMAVCSAACSQATGVAAAASGAAASTTAPETATAAAKDRHPTRVTRRTRSTISVHLTGRLARLGWVESRRPPRATPQERCIRRRSRVRPRPRRCLPHRPPPSPGGS